MVIAALKSLTWGTVVAAVVSAVLLAYAGGNMPRIAGDAVRSRPASPAQPGRVVHPNAPANDAQRGTPPGQGSASR